MFDIARIVLTVVILGFSAVPAYADFNKTHATNPKWTPHARYHVVWQVASYIGIGLVALGLLWIPGAGSVLRAYLAALLALCVYGGFYVAAASMRLYGGRLYDDNGYPPVPVKVMGRERRIDLNVTVFSTFVLLGLCGVGLVAAS
ncbi:DUF6640 family protein [Mycolicibacterium thermoresistibile]|jgi:hypothetical protein|uniref:Transmembrane protein n=2 Tax=Mycolicibacterium thermoresistibile TaxID=1797 RepID=G7CAY6_MYCT3|nr:DUF6640 family protein [Mycolicibacterium thermoresistibile]HLT11430.1 DUF6640 family protein [Micromonosporaceae bacterium]EHI14840.1 hypothetical protein KEK_00640 [Mycolicibacterium thermoresistibile ATCC 19527]MCV7190809.1 hypothetical protein [Mycolicibacterium thermoresistibile]SNW18648.1 Uncharacterised protein [Mycolicibacterium thermoresistibile]GAT16214.1 putative uncharacterized protein [Mycolicibacterium thermoresistibile]